MIADAAFDVATGRHQPRRGQGKLIQSIIKLICGTFAAVSIVTALGIVATFIFEAIAFLPVVPLSRFVTETRWTPLFASKQFGIVVLAIATMMVSVILVLVALPLCLLSAICLSEYATSKFCRILKPALEVLASVSTIASGIMITPIFASLRRNALGAAKHEALTTGSLFRISSGTFIL